MTAPEIPAPEVPTPILPPIVRHEGRGRPIEIAGGRLETIQAQLAFLAELARAIAINLQHDGEAR
jgi:hypothetical protein